MSTVALPPLTKSRRYLGPFDEPAIEEGLELETTSLYMSPLFPVLAPRLPPTKRGKRRGIVCDDAGLRVSNGNRDEPLARPTVTYRPGLSASHINARRRDVAPPPPPFPPPCARQRVVSNETDNATIIFTRFSRNSTNVTPRHMHCSKYVSNRQVNSQNRLMGRLAHS